MEPFSRGAKVTGFDLGRKYAGCTVISYDQSTCQYTLQLPRSGKIWIVHAMWVRKAGR